MFSVFPVGRFEEGFLPLLFRTQEVVFPVQRVMQCCKFEFTKVELSGSTFLQTTGSIFRRSIGPAHVLVISQNKNITFSWPEAVKSQAESRRLETTEAVSQKSAEAFFSN